MKADVLDGAAAASVAVRDRALEARFRAGEEAALDEVVRLYQEKVRRLVYRLGGWDRSQVDDVVQEVFVAAIGAASRFDGRSSLGTWLATITVNRCRTERRRRVVRVRYWRSVVAGWREGRGEEAGAERSERAGRVVEEVRRLPEKYREAVVLRYLEEMSIEEVAGVLGVSRAAVEVRLHRAREVMRERLADVWGEE